MLHLKVYWGSAIDSSVEEAIVLSFIHSSLASYMVHYFLELLYGTFFITGCLYMILSVANTCLAKIILVVDLSLFDNQRKEITS